MRSTLKLEEHTIQAGNFNASVYTHCLICFQFFFGVKFPHQFDFMKHKKQKQKQNKTGLNNLKPNIQKEQQQKSLAFIGSTFHLQQSCHQHL